MDMLADQWHAIKHNITIVCGDNSLFLTLSKLSALAQMQPTCADDLAQCLSSRKISETDHSSPILIDLRTGMDGTDSELSEMGLYCQRHGTRLVIVTDLERIDSFYGLLPEDLTQFVIGEDPAALLMAITVAKRTRTMGTFFDHRKDQNSPALSKISAELAEFARALSRIAEAEDDGDSRADFLADKPRSYMPPSGVIAQPFTSGSATAAEASLDPQDIRSLIRVRRLRDRFFQEELFADPAWDILLDLMASRLEGTKVSVSSLCIAAAVPATTALRWIKSMTDDGYLERRADPTDARRVYIHLSDATAQKMAQYLNARVEVSAI
jgi:DNA-binding MarR family transcriptional regulator